MANTLKNNAASQATAKLYLNDKLADVRFVFEINDEIETIPANKANLAALSPVFDAMFFGSLKESNEVKIVDASVEAFKEFLQFFYLGEVTLTMENIEIVARLADKYDVLEYVNACAEYLKGELKLDNMCWGLQLALYIKNQQLINFCENEISMSSKEVLASEAFQRCEKSTLEHILRMPLLCSETDVFNACIKWAKNACREDGLDENQPENVKAKLGDCFKLIQFHKLTLSEFIEIHTSNVGLIASEEFEDIILQMTRTAYKSKIFYECPRIRTFVWDDTTVLECKRPIVNFATRNVQRNEVVSFSSNHSVLLGEIWSSEIFFNGKRANGTNVSVTITQIEDKNFHSNDNPKVLYDGTRDKSSWSNGQLKVVLETPILIKPHNSYEICIGGAPGYTYKATWNSIAKLETGLEINFHRNPSLDYDNATTGWISTLKFNKL